MATRRRTTEPPAQADLLKQAVKRRRAGERIDSLMRYYQSAYPELSQKVLRRALIQA